MHPSPRRPGRAPCTRTADAASAKAAVAAVQLAAKAQAPCQGAGAWRCRRWCGRRPPSLVACRLRAPPPCCPRLRACSAPRSGRFRSRACRRRSGCGTAGCHSCATPAGKGRAVAGVAGRAVSERGFRGAGRLRELTRRLGIAPGARCTTSYLVDAHGQPRGHAWHDPRVALLGAAHQLVVGVAHLEDLLVGD